MPFETFKTFQASLETSARELAAKQLALVQTVAEKQKAMMANPALLPTQQSFKDNQALVQEFVTANQTFLSDSLLATQDYWRAQFAENQAALQAAGIPGAKEIAEQIQAAVSKVTASAKTTRTKR